MHLAEDFFTEKPQIAQNIVASLPNRCKPPI